MQIAAPKANSTPSHWIQWVNFSPKTKYATSAPPITIAASHMMHVHIIDLVARLFTRKKRTAAHAKIPNPKWWPEPFSVYHLRWLFPKSSAAVMANTYIAAMGPATYREKKNLKSG